MNMTDVRCFIKVVELMSFSKAAEALYISQQAVSIHIKRLEESYRVRLFERKPTLKLTESGKILFDATTEIIQREEALADQLTSSQNEFYGEISIGFPPNRTAAFAAEFIPAFIGKYPNMTVHLVEKTSLLLPTAVKQNEIDLAIPLVSRYAPIPNAHLFVSLSLEIEDSYLVISDQLLEKHFGALYPACKSEFRAGVSLKDFASVPMFLRPSSSRLHEEIVSLLLQADLTPIIRIQTVVTSTLLTLCAQGYGLFFSPPMLLRHMYNEQPQHFKSLNIFPVNELRGKRESLMIYHKHKQLTRPLRDSIEIIKANYYRHTLEVNDFKLDDVDIRNASRA